MTVTLSIVQHLQALAFRHVQANSNRKKFIQGEITITKKTQRGIEQYKTKTRARRQVAVCPWPEPRPLKTPSHTALATQNWPK